MARIALPSIPALNAAFSPDLKPALFLTIALTGTIIVVLMIGLLSAQPQVPLYYSLTRADQQLAPKLSLLLFAALSITITLVHFLLLATFKQLDLLLLKLFSWTTVLIQALLLMALVRIVVVIS